MNLIPGTGMVPPPPPPPPPDDDDVVRSMCAKKCQKKRVMKERWTGRKNKDKEEISKKKKNLSVREMIDLFVLF